MCAFNGCDSFCLACSSVGSDAVAQTGPAFLKGHGTQNDFVVLLDPEGEFGLTESQVRALCDRRRGLGADGVLRAVPANVGSGWFMDYRNGDGSIAEMCGNGARVFALAMRDMGWEVAEQFVLQTRGGARSVRFSQGGVTIGMGAATTADREVSVTVGDRRWDATPVWVPNPHAVVVVDDLSEAGRLASPPQVEPQAVFPDGVNVEFVVDRGHELSSDGAVARIGMRVHERGAGETPSCGTGAVAAAWAWRRRAVEQGQQSYETTRVDVPGGTLWVTEQSDGQLDLTGPAVITARGSIDEHWWKENA